MEYHKIKLESSSTKFNVVLLDGESITIMIVRKIEKTSLNLNTSFDI